MTGDKRSALDEEFRRKAHEIIDELQSDELAEAAYYLEELLISNCEAAAKSGRAEVVGSERRVFKRLQAHVPAR